MAKLKLQQDQIWQQGDDYYFIVRLERLSVDYKLLKDPVDKRVESRLATKKGFCRLIKDATLLTPEKD